MGGLSQFIQGPQLIAQIINFLLLVFLLYRFLYKPILGVIDRRAAHIQTGLDRAKQAQQALAEANERAATILNQARQESQGIVTNANTTAQHIVEQARADADKQANDMINRAQAQIALERQRMAQELRSQVAELALLAASKVVEKNLDTPTQRNLVEQAINESTLLQPQSPSLS